MVTTWNHTFVPVKKVGTVKKDAFIATYNGIKAQNIKQSLTAIVFVDASFKRDENVTNLMTGDECLVCMYI